MSMGKFHFPKNTVEAACWCDSCGRETPHRIDDGRRGPCLDPAHGRQRKLLDVREPAGRRG